MFIFYPILQAPNCQGRTVVHNYPPNNWEIRRNCKKNINITWSDGIIWKSKKIGYLDINKSFTIKEEDLKFVPNGALALSSLSVNELPYESEFLPDDTDMQTNLPEWRASLGLESTLGANTSFQGEGYAFPRNGSLLSFSPFLQYGSDLSNYLLFINIEKLQRIWFWVQFRRTHQIRVLFGWWLQYTIHVGTRQQTTGHGQKRTP